MIIEEIHNCILDREEGKKSGQMILISLATHSKQIRDLVPPSTIATFYERKQNILMSLSGDFSGIQLKIGSKYNVMYLNHTRMIVDIEKYHDIKNTKK